jgi:hypothetical protein
MQHVPRSDETELMTTLVSSREADGFRSEAREWRRFARVLLLTLWPALVITGILEAIAWRTGETVSAEAIARWQSEKPGRMWRGGDGRSYLGYKIARVRLLKPDVIMLGQSRANSFSGDALRPYTFYNCGLTAWTFKQYLRFLELITTDGYAPRVLFFNFDYWMFSKDFDLAGVWKFYGQFPTHAEEIKFVIDEMEKHPLALIRRLPYADELKGLYAVLSGDGFQPDGTLVAGLPTADPRRLDQDGTGVGVSPVQLGTAFDNEEIQAFERFVNFAHEKNIRLIGIQVPFYAKILYGLNKDPSAGIWREFRSEARKAYFESKDVIFFDFVDMPEYRDKPEHFIDSIHPDARVFRDILLRVLRDPRVKEILPSAQSG